MYQCTCSFCRNVDGVTFPQFLKMLARFRPEGNSETEQLNSRTEKLRCLFLFVMHILAFIIYRFIFIVYGKKADRNLQI